MRPSHSLLLAAVIATAPACVKKSTHQKAMADLNAKLDTANGRITSLEGDVLLFGHGHFSRVLGARLIGLPPSDGGLLMLSPGTISVVASEHDVRAIRVWNWSPSGP